MSAIVVGSINMDLVLKVDHFPAAGETISASDLQTYHGGKGANQAVSIARLGKSVRLVGKVGDDAHGPVLLDGLRRNNVDTESVFIALDSPSGQAYITVDPAGQNSIVLLAGANGRLEPLDVEQAFQVLPPDCRLFVTQLEVPIPTVEKAIQLAQGRGLKTIFNPAPALPIDLLTPILAQTEILVLNETETQILTGSYPASIETAMEAGRKLLDAGPETVIITMGAAGSVVVDREQHQHLPAPKVTVVDTTAAGDAFIGGLCVALMEQRPLLDCVQFANLAGAVTVTDAGAQPSLPTYEALLAMQDQSRSAKSSISAHS